MSFSDEIKKSSSEKFSLIRLSCSSIINPTSIGSNLYTFEISHDIYEVFSDLVELVKVDGTPSSGQYSISGSTVTIYSSTASPDVVARFYFYVTSDKNRAIGKDPIYPSVDLIEWSGRLKDNPTFTQSVENLQTGTLSMSVSEIRLINHDGKYNFLFEKTAYVNNMAFDVWFCCNGAENITKAFSGVCVECSMSGSEISIKTKDTMSRLDRKCYMKDTLAECFFTTGLGGNYPNGDTSKNGSVIPFLTGRSTDYSTDFNFLSATVFYPYDPTSLREAYCCNYSATVGTSVNREFVLYRTTNGMAFLEPVTFSGTDFTFSSEEIASHFLPGDTFSCAGAILRTVGRSGRVVYAVLISGSMPSSPNFVFMTQIPLVLIERSGIFYECVHIRDYTISSSVTSGGNTLYKITFTNNFEANVSLPSALDPSSDIVRFRAHNEELNHDAIAKIILDEANIPNTFTGTYTDNKICMGIPALGESDYGSSLSYLEKILKSNASFIYQKLDGNFDYKEFSVPTSPIEITENDYILNSLRIEENAQDIYSTIKFTQESLLGPYGNLISQSLSLATGLSNEYDFVTVNFEIEPPILAIYRLVLKSVKYLFSTKKVGYDFNLGDFVKVKDKDLTVVSISKSIDKIDFVAVDTYTY